jgi:hypothetical protein
LESESSVLPAFPILAALLRPALATAKRQAHDVMHDAATIFED